MKFAHEFAGCGVDDSDLKVLGEEQDSGAGVGAADGDVVESSCVAEGDDAVLGDLVVSDPVVAVVVSGAVRGRFREGLVAAGGGGVVGKRSVRAVVV